MVEAPAQAAAGAQPFGPFLLDRRIAVGGSAEVFLARPKNGSVPAPRLVIKRLLPSTREAGDFDALERESQLHRAVTHPNVVTVYGAGMVGDEPYLAMEYVDGVDLFRVMRRAESEQRRFPLELAAHICHQVALALESVHKACDADGKALNIVHRDVTPSNVYLSADGQIKLGDFGIARTTLRTRREATVGLKGKFAYLAPEQVAGEPFDHRADIFALTVMLGEMLIGRRIFPGSGQLAVLLSIREVNIEPLRRFGSDLPQGLLDICERGLCRDPELRYANAGQLAQELERFVQPNQESLKQLLAEWVVWAGDAKNLAQHLENRIRESVQHIRAVQNYSTTRKTPAPAASQLRRAGSTDVETLSFSRLIELIATGSVGGEDEVALLGAGFSMVRQVPELARHLLPSTTAVTGRLFEPGAPDYRAVLEDTPMLAVLARMRQSSESGALFVTRNDQETLIRKEIYLQRGRLLHVASSEREELLGEYLVRRGRISREQLDQALERLAEFGGRLGDTMVSMGFVEAVDVFQTIRDQGRDRVAALCGWSSGNVSFYRGTEPGIVVFPLDLDLTSPMMMGAIVSSKGRPRTLLPPGDQQVRAGRRAEAALRQQERGTAPSSLQRIVGLARTPLSVDDILLQLTQDGSRPGARVITEKEACAALVVAQALGWIAFQAPPR